MAKPPKPIIPFKLGILPYFSTWTAICLWTLPVAVQAKELPACTPIELLDQIPSELPVLGQKFSPTCYLHAAYSIADYYHRRFPQHHAPPNLEKLIRGLDHKGKWVLNVNSSRTSNSFEYIFKNWRLPEQNPRRALSKRTDFIRTEKGWELESPETFRQGLREYFSREHQFIPLALEYCSGVLKHNGSQIHKRTFRKDLNYLSTSEDKENFTEKCGFHVSIITGRKQDEKGQCWYRIQNSWGESCKRYPANSRPCDRGRIWVPENELIQNTVRLVEFTP